MKTIPHADVSVVEALLDKVSKISADGVFEVTNLPQLRNEVGPKLAPYCISMDKSVRKAVFDAVWTLGQWMGMPAVDATRFLETLKRDEVAPFVTPAFEIREMPFELCRIVFDAANNMEVGPLLFLTSQSDPGNAGRVAGVLLAAICENFQGPVLFVDRNAKPPIPVSIVDWYEWLFVERTDVSRDGQLLILGQLAQRSTSTISRQEWRDLYVGAAELWEPVREQLSDICCDMFEDMEVSETFTLLKRYLIPTLDSHNFILSQVAS